MTTIITVTNVSAQDLEIAAKRTLVRRTVESATFTKSERLWSFLICICDIALNGRANEINEQTIGTSVFGRSPDYETSIDGISLLSELGQMQAFRFCCKNSNLVRYTAICSRSELD